MGDFDFDESRFNRRLVQVSIGSLSVALALVIACDYMNLGTFTRSAFLFVAVALMCVWLVTGVMAIATSS